MDIRTYLNNSYTAYHTVENTKKILEENGFLPYNIGVKAEKDGKYYVIKNGSAIVAFKVGTLENFVFNIAEAHTDSPSLKIKGRTLLNSPEGLRINVEAYGGLIRYSFMDIPLRIAGRLLIATENGLKQVNVASNFTVNIPSLCIHHNPEVNDKCALNVQVDMLPLVGGIEPDLYKLLGYENAVDGDLYVVPDTGAFYSGAQNEFLCSPRVDNLTSCYGAAEGIIKAAPKGVAVAVLFDNEEIGSHTKQGAHSDFLPALLKRIADDLGMAAEYINGINNGFCLSIDNGHAIHPAHPEKSDLNTPVKLNGGIVIKHHANYSTDGFSSAAIKTILNKADIKYQDYYNRSDIRCGGTLGLVTSAQLQMNAADIGLAQLAMHSAIETVGAYDIALMTECVKAFLESAIITDGDIVTIL